MRWISFSSMPGAEVVTAVQWKVIEVTPASLSSSTAGSRPSAMRRSSSGFALTSLRRVKCSDTPCGAIAGNWHSEARFTEGIR